MTPITVVPAAGRRVRKEDGQLLAAEGEAVLLTSYWLRRIADRDVVRPNATARRRTPKRNPA
ncbi:MULTISPECIES: DUF2635 domain-containing protein [unclassified Sphingomonas]|uniref:DUF2635 domain-containing protein n=1 Tax=unclassified Sphingomonas TaxID=196159 RepID=UPI0008305E60|nr:MULTISPECIES: DUF2635 domain-containing protein [unclassified Sphingomonas]